MLDVAPYLLSRRFAHGAGSLKRRRVPSTVNRYPRKSEAVAGSNAGRGERPIFGEPPEDKDQATLRQVDLREETI